MGFAFLAPNRVLAEQRCSPRFAINLPVLLHCNGSRYAATIANIGEGGVMVRSALHCSVGASVVIHCGSTEVLATIAWRYDNGLGLSFARTLSVSEVEEHLGRSRAVAERRRSRLSAI